MSHCNAVCNTMLYWTAFQRHPIVLFHGHWSNFCCGLDNNIGANIIITCLLIDTNLLLQGLINWGSCVTPQSRWIWICCWHFISYDILWFSCSFTKAAQCDYKPKYISVSEPVFICYECTITFCTHKLFIKSSWCIFDACDMTFGLITLVCWK